MHRTTEHGEQCRAAFVRQVMLARTLIMILCAPIAAVGDPGLQTALDDLRIQQDVPGISAVVIYDREIVFAGGSGVADLETRRPATADTVYYIGSVSKVLTAIFTLRLAERNELGLDSDVADITQIAPGSHALISVKHLLNHTSGLEREGDFGYWFSAVFPNDEALSAYLVRTRLRSEPGTKLHYSNIGFAALGQVIESATGLPYGIALQEQVLGPLGMSASGAQGPAAGVANGYTPAGHIMPGASRPFAGLGKRVGDRHVRMYHNAGAMSPAFGAYSTARDLGTLALFLLGKGDESVLSRKTRQSIWQPQPLGRGLGVGLEHDGDKVLVTHGGWFAAHKAQLLVDPANGTAVAVLANSDNAEPRRIADALYRVVTTNNTVYPYSP